MKLEGAYDVASGKIIPRYLTARDDPWVRGLQERFEQAAGMTRSEAAPLVADAAREAIRRGAHPAAVGRISEMLHVELLARPTSVLKPRDVRRVLYEEGATARRGGAPFSANEALRRARERLGLASDIEVLPLAFVDFEEARRIVIPREAESTTSLVELRERHNLALVQALLARALWVEALVREHARAVVRFAKLKRLLCTFAEDERGMRIRISGPLSLFGPTFKYGRAFSSFVPHVVSSPGFVLEARCSVGGLASSLLVSAADPIHRAHALPQPYDSDLERRLSRALRRLNSKWSLIREGHALRAGTSVVFPDFTMTSDRGAVHVEVVGFWTPEYLARKQRDLALVREPIVVCVDAQHAVPTRAFGDHEVVRYRRDVNPLELLQAVERALGRSRITHDA